MSAVMELTMPRICHVPEADDWSLGDQAVEWSLEHGLRLDDEQQMLLRSMLGLDPQNRWSTFEWAVNAPRQNGKNEVLIARELFGVYVLGEMLIVHSAHEFKTSSRHFTRMEQVIRSNEELSSGIKRSDKAGRRQIGFRYSHGDEAIDFESGAKIEFRTRTKAGMKGFDDVSLLVLDEAQILSEWAHGAMVPTLRASTAPYGPQLIYSGNAADKEKHDHAVVWTRLRERGMAGDDEDLAYHEWSLDYEAPEEIPENVASDPEMWARVNWAMPHGRITQDHMRKEIKILGWREFCIELLGVGDYPDTDLLGNSEIDMETWQSREDEKSVLVGPVHLALDVAPGPRTTIAAAGLNGEGKAHVEVAVSRGGTVWVADKVAQMLEEHEVVAVVCDGFGPGNAIAGRIEEQTGWDVRRLKSGEFADACGSFAIAVEEGELVHIGQSELTDSVRGARTRPLIDRWAWSRSKSRTDPSPVIACSMAHWAWQMNPAWTGKVGIF